MTGLLVGTAAVALATLAPAPGTAAAAVATPDSLSLRLQPCTPGGVRARCGSLRVPEDRSDPDGRSIALRVVVVPSTDPTPRADPVVFLAGGPGQAATASVRALARTGFRERRDLVLVDQRGTGGSSSLDCRLETAGAAADAFLAGRFPRERLEACRRSWDADVRAYTTGTFADDLEAVRRALGHERLNLVAGSYGTRVAQVYARRYPERVRTLVLRGVAPLAYRVPVPFAEASQAALDSLFAACRGAPSCRASHPDLEDTLERVRAELRRAPRTVAVSGPDGETSELTLDEAVLNGTLLVSLYYAPWAEQLPALLAAAADGRWRPLAERAARLAAFFDEQIHLGLFVTVVCSEDRPRIGDGELEARGRGTFLGASWARGVLAPCDSWPASRPPASFFRPLRTDTPALLISGARDPVTPPAWGEVAARTLPASLHLVLPGTAHLPAWPGCVERLVAAFVEAGTAEGLDTACVRELARRGP